jgi:epsin
MQQQWAQQQAEWAQQQQLAQQQAEWAQQQQLAQQQALQQQQQQQLAQQQALQQQQQYAWLLQQQQQQQTALAPQPTGFGSRNPFALGSTPSPAPPVPAISPTISPPPTNVQQFQNPSPSPALASNPPAVKTRPDENTALAALFANRDGGIDTFGNYGNLR